MCIYLFFAQPFGTAEDHGGEENPRGLRRQSLFMSTFIFQEGQRVNCLLFFFRLLFNFFIFQCF